MPGVVAGAGAIALEADVEQCGQVGHMEGEMVVQIETKDPLSVLDHELEVVAEVWRGHLEKGIPVPPLPVICFHV